MGECASYVWTVRESELDFQPPAFFTYLFYQAVAALDEHPETKVEAMHLGIALAYHGLLRVPSRAEASDYDIRKRAVLCFSS